MTCDPLLRIRSASIAFRVCILMMLSGSVMGQIAQDTSKDKVHVDHADIVIREIINGHDYAYMNGDVELSQDSVFLYCDSARIIDSREVLAFGNVIIQKGDSLEVFADTLLYFADTRIADLTGEVALIHGAQELWTTHLTYDLGLNVATYDEPAQLLQDSTQLSSNRGVYWVDTDEALFIDSVVVLDEGFSLISDSLRYNASLQLARFIAPTWIIQDGARIYCEDGFYDIEGGKAEFRQNAEYRKGDQHAWAETILYDAKTNEVSLIDDAHFEENDLKAAGDTIIYNEKTGDTRIAGNAEFDDETRHVRSRVIKYNQQTEVLGTLGRGSITEGNQVLTADSMHYDQKTGLGEMRGNVIIEDTSAHTVIQAENADIRQEAGYMKAYGSTRPVLKSLLDTDTMYLTAETLITFETPDSIQGDTIRFLTGYHDVRIFRGTLQGRCDSISFDGRDSIFRMYGSPILWSDTTQFTADTIDLFIRNKTLSRVILRQNALIISSLFDVFYNQIKGRFINTEIIDNDISNMHVIGNAESVYYAQDDEQAFLGVNQVASSEIYFIFAENKIDQIRFTTQPSGTMTPMHQIDHLLLRLDGFIWRVEERPKTLDDLF